VLVHHELIATSGQARRGRLHTPHGTVETPVFMPVGTVGSVKSLTPRDLTELGAEIILGNTYHLHLRPGEELVKERGGLHKFVSWPRAMLTDSGGFQVFSLSERRKISEEGVEFRSHLDGRKLFFSPESVMGIEMALGADVIMAFDECPPALSEKHYHEESMARTTRWLHRCRDAWRTDSGTSLFGIVQGGLHEDLRRRHVEEVCAVDLPGYALGGFAVGEEPAQLHAGVAFAAPLLPKDKPRYLMGVGTLEDLVRGVEAGVDMFDCVMPTRCARNGLLFTRTGTGRMNIKNQQFARDDRPVDEKCGCFTCRHFTRAYLRHLYAAGELSAYSLNSIHNLWTYAQLMRDIRAAIEVDAFDGFVRDFFAHREALPPRTAGARKRPGA
jgi:queuine tRNA-ribosyltransferase